MFLFLVQLEDYIPGVEEFYRKNHSGRKLQWHHLMSNGVVSAVFLRSIFLSLFFFVSSHTGVGKGAHRALSC